MKKISALFLSLFAFTFAQSTFVQTAFAQDAVRTYLLSNSSKEEVKDAPIEQVGIEGYRSALVTIGDKETPCQMDDLDGDGGADHLFFITNIPAKGKIKATVKLWRQGKPREYTPRVFASLMLRNHKPRAKNKNDIYLGEFSSLRGTNPFAEIHQHGAVFESEQTAYRLYCSPRQTVDIYGKRKRQLELKESEFYPDELQLASGFGDDVLVVGDGVGLGALNGWDGTKPVAFTDCDSRSQRIVAAGPLRTIVEVVDKNWRPSPEAEPMTLTTRYTMIAGHRDCRVDASISVPKGFTITDEMKHQLYFTGITNIRGSVEFNDGKGLRGCWGTDYPVTGKDTLTHKKETVGMGICIPRQNIVKVADTDRDYGYVVTMTDNHITYYITFCSDKELQGYHSAKDWFNYLKDWKKELNNKAITTTN